MESKDELWKINQSRDKCITCIGLFCKNDSYSTLNVPDNLMGNMLDWSWDKITRRLRVYEVDEEKKE